MIWLVVIALAGLAFAAAAFVFGLPRPVWTIFGAVLLFGLAGYGVQGSPGQPAAPRAAIATEAQSGEAMVAQRREFFDPNLPLPRYVILADGFTRDGQYERAAEFLGVALEENPQDAEGWVALGNVLVEHADGTLTPAAGEAYQRAARYAPDNPAPPYFLGLAMLRGGRLAEADELWQQALAMTEEDASYRPILAQRSAALQALSERVSAQGEVMRAPPP